MSYLWIAVFAMMAQQSLATMSVHVVQVLAPVIAADIGVNPAAIGGYSALIYLSTMGTALGCGGFIKRFGPLRMSQVALIGAMSALLVGVPGLLILFALGGALMGLAYGFSTPASSDIIARYTTPKTAGLAFSIKQTGVPIGGILAGSLMPLLALYVGWRGAVLTSAGLCLLLTLLLQPLRREYDRHRSGRAGSGLAGISARIATIARDRRLRDLGIAAITYGGLQSTFIAFMTTYMVTRLGYGIALAGAVFAISQAASIAARILWGWLGTRYLGARPVLAGLGFLAAASAAATAFFAPSWPVAAVTAVAVAYSASAISWHGILLAEVARLAPKDDVGGMTGAVIATGSIGSMSYPLIFGIILGLTGSFTAGFLTAAVPAALTGLLFLRRRESPAETDQGFRT
ncbi:MAG: MFS transporter [Alphaproteobacteria bacterium]